MDRVQDGNARLTALSVGVARGMVGLPPARSQRSAQHIAWVEAPQLMQHGLCATRTTTPLAQASVTPIELPGRCHRCPCQSAALHPATGVRP
jgi:hypothetical protein